MFFERTFRSAKPSPFILIKWLKVKGQESKSVQDEVKNLENTISCNLMGRLVLFLYSRRVHLYS